MRKNLNLLKLLLVCSIFSLLTTSACTKSNGAVCKHEKELRFTAPPKSINEFISNADSDYEYTESFDTAVRQFMRRNDIHGASFALMKDGKLIYAKGYGMADVENQIPMESYHLLRVASVSKLFTSVGVLKLFELGLLSPDDYVFGEEGILNDSIFLNIKDKRLKQIKVIDLLRHEGGFSTPFGDPCFNLDQVAKKLGKPLPITLDDMVVYATQNRLNAAPGTSYKYSNLGYVVLSKVIEEASCMDYEEYMREVVFAPALCMDMHLTENYKHDRRKNEVSYYDVKDAQCSPAIDRSDTLVYRCNGGNDVRLLYGTGAWCGSPAEILRFATSIDSILPEEYLHLMTGNDRPIGWSRATEDFCQRTGTMSGTNAFLKKENNGYSWIFVTNTSSPHGFRFNNTINNQISSLINRVEKWPERDLFKAELYHKTPVEIPELYINVLPLSSTMVRPNTFIGIAEERHD